jgi:hypothetical protein
MHHATTSGSSRLRLRSLALAAALLFALPAWAGPPLLCHPFDTAGAPSLPWGQGWNQVDRRYQTAQLPADTLRLLGPKTPVIARMETLRRAAIYASAEGERLRALSAGLEARIKAAKDAPSRALALFDAGYFAETLQDVARLQGYDMPGIGKVDVGAVKALLARGDGSVRIADALELRPNDASMRLAAALVATADRRTRDYELHARVARAGARGDRLAALNLDKIAN